MDKQNDVLIYEDKDGLTKVNVTFTDGHIEKGTIQEIIENAEYKYRVLIKREHNNIVVFCTNKDIQKI